MKRSIRARAPASSSQRVREAMQRVGRVDTACERRLRSALHQAGLRFRINRQPDPQIRCKVDLVFPRQRICVFVDGCFWHGCSKHFRPPKTNRAWWVEKVKDVKARDHRQTVELRQRHWKVMRCWEHEVINHLPRVVKRIAAAVRARGESVGAH